VVNPERTTHGSGPFGRRLDVTLTSFDVGRWYYDSRLQIAQDAAILRQLIEAVAWTNDLWPSQWAQWYSVALGFKPDLILELGRGRGNSTAVFVQAAARLGSAKVVSLCNSGDWTTQTAPKVKAVVDDRWFDSLDARMTDIINAADYGEILGNHRRVLLLWDAHGFEIAEVVLGEILPRLRNREHLVIMHDITDNRYAGASPAYGGPLWKGSEWQQRTGTWSAGVSIGWMNSIQDQIIAIADFSARNGLDVQSADHEYARFFSSHPDCAAEMRTILGEEWFSTIAQWAFFSLGESDRPLEFPEVASRRTFAQRSAVVLSGVDHLPATITTPVQPWSFASVWQWRPEVKLPAGAAAALRVRLEVEHGSVGVGLLDANGRDFTVRYAIAPTNRPTELHLPVADIAQPHALVVTTWAAPVVARVHIHDVELVW
jgi:SAM-dependent methyltransferase